MRGRPAPRLALVLLGACACASAPKPLPTAPAEAPGPARRALPRSSIVAVLAHRAELALDDDQVRQLERIQSELDKKDAHIRRELATHAATGSSPSGDAEPPPQDRHRGGRAGGAGGGPRGRGGARTRGAPTSGDLQQALDDADTAAFYEAEKVLRDEQRERARAFAESYREALYDARERARREASAPHS